MKKKPYANKALISAKACAAWIFAAAVLLFSPAAACALPSAFQAQAAAMDSQSGLEFEGQYTPYKASTTTALMYIYEGDRVTFRIVFKLPAHVRRSSI